MSFVRGVGDDVGVVGGAPAGHGDVETFSVESWRGENHAERAANERNVGW